MNINQKIVSTQNVLKRIKPGMTIFVGTGVSEPKALVNAIMDSWESNLQDLELIQLVSLGDALRRAVSIEERYSYKYRLKTFFAGWVANEAISTGRVDLIPVRFSRIPRFIQSGELKIDVAFVQVTPPDDSGNMSLGLSIDVARQAMNQAGLVVGEINANIPRTCGDTLVSVDNFDLLIESTEPPIYAPRSEINAVYDKLGETVASLISDGSCLSFFIGSLFESLGIKLQSKRDLGIHTPFFTDALMDLVKSGAVTNQNKAFYKGKTLTAYAFGSQELNAWLDGNDAVEFHPINVVGNPINIGKNERFSVILSAKSIDFTGGITLHSNRGNVAAGPGEAHELIAGAVLSEQGQVICALPSLGLNDESNIMLSVEALPNQFPSRELIDIVVTEYGVAKLSGRTIRERALSLIDIAHPDHRDSLFHLAKENHLLYPAQTYLPDSGYHCPSELSITQTFKDNLAVFFRPIKPSDVDEMRRLFYRFSKEEVYARYFANISTMPHNKMQEYVNIDYQDSMAVVGLVGGPHGKKLIAEARYVRYPDTKYADVAFLVDDEYHNKGISTFLFKYLLNIARDRGFEGFKANVLETNISMLKVFEKSPFPIQQELEGGVFDVTIPFYSQSS